jgi:N-acetylated-alpha-linked acidic dipeptidase
MTFRWPLTAGAATLGALVLAQAPGPSPSLLPGFTPSRSAEQRAIEARFVSELSRPAMSELHRTVTARPHIAGTPGSMVVVEAVRQAFDRAGLQTEIHEYLAHLSTPVRVSVDIVTPEAEVLATREPPSPLDPTSDHPELGAAFVAYSASGTVSAPVVFVNYGLPADYTALDRAGVDVRGRIVVARYARSHRAVKIHTAETRGAAGIIIYSDPLDDGYARGLTWPDGPWRADFQTQSGNGKYSWFWHGDPLTPGVAATADAPSLDAADAPTLPRIPAVVLSSREASKILSKLEGPPVPAGFQGGLPFTYRLGPGPVTVRLDVEMDAGRRPVCNVIAKLAGRDPDRWVMLGTHHDAWTFGGMDPGSGLAPVYGVAHALGRLRRSGWVPDRTLVFAIWDAEEFGLIGSTEYAEALAPELREKVVCYINTDLSMVGRFDGGGTPSLRDFLVEVAKDVPGLSGRGSVYDAWREDAWRLQPAARRRQGREGFEVELAALGSGADFVAFQDHLGLPTLQMEFDFDGSYGAYHSNYDSRWYVERFSDPGFDVAHTLAQVLGRTMMRLGSADILPFRYSHYARLIEQFLDESAGWAQDEEGRQTVVLDLAASRRSVAAIRARADELERALAARLSTAPLPDGRAREVNDALVRLEQTLLDESAPARERWYRHVIYGWDIHSLYAGQPLPGLADAVRRRDQAAVDVEQRRVAAALERLRVAIDAIQP